VQGSTGISERLLSMADYTSLTTKRTQQTKRETHPTNHLLFEDHKGRYGSPRITDQLQKEGFSVTEKKVARIMKKLELTSCVVKKFKVNTTDSKHDSNEN
jgi:putative transposase